MDDNTKVSDIIENLCAFVFLFLINTYPVNRSTPVHPFKIYKKKWK